MCDKCLGFQAQLRYALMLSLDLVRELRGHCPDPIHAEQERKLNEILDGKQSFPIDGVTV